MLEFKNVSGKEKDFNLKDINFVLPAGYIMGLAGKNGAGKSTLLDYILNRQQRYTGEILLDGRDIRHGHIAALGKIGFISEDNIFPMEKTAKSIAEVYGQIYDVWDKELFCSAMAKMEVPTDQWLCRLSRGQYLKFQTAFAMAHKPKLYLVDEATAGMDPVFRIEYFQILQEIIAQEKASVLMTSHIEDEIARKMDYVGIMEAGKLVQFGESIVIYDKA